MKHGVLRALVLLSVLLLTSGCVAIPLPIVLHFLLSEAPDPSTLTVTVGDAQVIFPLHGGIKSRIAVDPTKVLSLAGVQAQIIVDEISVAGESVTLELPGVSAVTGTTCAAENPADPSSGTATARINPLTLTPTVATANLHVGTLATDALIGVLVAAGQIALSGDVSKAPVKLNIAKLMQLSVDGAITIPVAISGSLPADVPLIGGAPFVLKSTLMSSTQPSAHPLLAACAAFFAKVRGQASPPPTPRVQMLTTPPSMVVPTRSQTPTPTRTVAPTAPPTATPTPTATPLEDDAVPDDPALTRSED